jgi:hypothetical protein
MTVLAIRTLSCSLGTVMGTQLNRFAVGLLILFVVFGSADPARICAMEPDLSGTVRAAEAAGIPSAVLNRLLAFGYAQNWDPGKTDGLLRTLIGVQQSGLPLQPFVSKVEEGLAKRIDPVRIAQVLEKKADDYRFTQSLLADRSRKLDQHETSVPAEDRIRLSELFSAGLQRQDIKQLFEDAPSAPLSVMIRSAELLASLRQIRFDPRLAGQIVSLGLKQHYFTANQADFGRVIAVAKNRGRPDTDITAAALAVIQSNASTGQLASRLGLSSEDLGARGPQVGGQRSGRGPEGVSSGPGQGQSSSSGSGRDRGDLTGGGGGVDRGGGSGGSSGGNGGGGGSGGGGRR